LSSLPFTDHNIGPTGEMHKPHAHWIMAMVVQELRGFLHAPHRPTVE
jgi:hypothetical protein